LPIISQFYGIIISMHYRENEKHKLPHLHAEYGDFDATYDLESNKVSGTMPNKQQKMIQAWILIHQEELKALWKLIETKRDGWFRIEPLK